MGRAHDPSNDDAANSDVPRQFPLGRATSWNGTYPSSVSDSASAEMCPRCGGTLRFGGWMLCVREDDGKRVCQVPWLCSSCETAWAGWADRRDDPLWEDADAYRFLSKRG